MRGRAPEPMVMTPFSTVTFPAPKKSDSFQPTSDLPSNSERHAAAAGGWRVSPPEPQEDRARATPRRTPASRRAPLASREGRQPSGGVQEISSPRSRSSPFSLYGNRRSQRLFGTEGRGRQTLDVVEGAVREIGPTIAHVERRGSGRAGHHYSIACDARGGGHPAAVRAGDLESPQCAAPRHQAGAGVVEPEAQHAALPRGAAKERTGVDKLLAVYESACHERQTAAHFGLVLWVNAVALAEIGGHGHARVGRAERPPLGLAQLGPLAVGRGREASQLHKQERKDALIRSE